MPKRPSEAIEFLKGRIYLGAYDYSPQDSPDLVYFTVENSLPYNPFHLDFGPLHIGHLYRFAVILHNILNDENNQGKAIVFYSTTDVRERTNAACILCCYMILIQSWAPHQVLQPISQCDPPLMSFRDAGYSAADFELSIQDIVYGIWRAKERNMIDLSSFNLEEYEQYERVDQGDFNVVSKDFIAFASPQQSRSGAPLNEPFKKVLGYFIENDVQLVVRLNSHLYDAKEFTKRNIKHIDMIFDDGTCPTMEYVQKFVGAAETVINNGGKIAVHCKAGLGRTGCLIGAHLIYTHGFTANECIGYMRMIRPGMVVGPQQHWLYLHQNEFRNWRHTMVLDDVPDQFIGGLYPLVPYDLYKQRMRKLKKLQQQSQQSPSSHSNHESSFATPTRRRISNQLTASAHNAVPSNSPGQPRKSPTRSEDEYQSSKIASSPQRRPIAYRNENIITNSDEETMDDENINRGYDQPAGDTIEDEAIAAVASISTTPKRISSENYANNSSNSPWKVLRSITNPNSPNHTSPTLPIHLTRTTTKTTTTTTTTVSSSPPHSGNTSGSVLPKARNRVSSSSLKPKNRSSSGEKILGNGGGVRKVSQGARDKRW